MPARIFAWLLGKNFKGPMKTGLQIFVLVVAALLGAAHLGAAPGTVERRRTINEAIAEERYWKKAHAEQQKLQEAEDRWRESQRQYLKAVAPEIVKAGQSLQPTLLIAEDGPPPPPPEPTLYDRYPDEVRLAWVLALLLAVSALVIARHKNELRIRVLCGDYLSDGTEVACYKLPEWFAAEPTPVPAAHADFLVEANKSSLEAEVAKPAAEFFQEAPGRLAKIRDVWKELAGATELATRQEILGRAREWVSELREKAAPWECRPAWQISSALELLLQRVAEKPKDATPSVVRTIATALDVLNEVCVPGIRPNLLTDPPIKILAVDDDALCRRALEFALAKAHLVPDLAADGEKAVELANAHAYDVVFMDIQMPGIDGLTACRQIHETKRNPDVPVIFVTSQADFNTRAQSRLKGGTDLMAKPFLLFELTVRAVTFAMHKRLQLAVPNRREVIVRLPAKADLETVTVASPDTQISAVQESRGDVENILLKPGELSGDFYSNAPDYLEATRKLVQALRLRTENGNVQDLAGALYLRVHTVANRAASENLAVTSKVSSALESLCKRLYRNPKNVTPSTLNTVSNALRTLQSLCVPGMEAKLAHHPAVKILVADDEPLSRRAVVGALQLAFDQPDSAADGEEASIKISETAYDVIFTDVEMPKVDGFELCGNIRRSRRNGATPVAFITSHTGQEAQLQAAEAGGNDFISKPFLPVEITVKALTLTWENRLRRFNAPHSSAPSLPENTANATQVA